MNLTFSFALGLSDKVFIALVPILSSIVYYIINKKKNVHRYPSKRPASKHKHFNNRY